MSDKFEVVGLDVANSTIKGVCGSKHIIYRNTVKELQGAVQMSFKNDERRKMEFEYNGKRYEVGGTNAGGSGGRTIARYTSAGFKLEALLAIAQLVPKNSTVRVVIGVPSALSMNDEVNEGIQDLLIGKHKVKQGKKVIKFTIDDVMVVSQPSGTVFDLLQNIDGSYKNKEIKDTSSLILDVGYGTTDISVLEDQELRSTFGFDKGASDYVSMAQEKLNILHPKGGFMNLTAHDLDLQLRDGKVTTVHNTFDTSEVSEECKQLLAKQIYQKIMSQGFNFNHFNRIIATGGGALLLGDCLTELFDDERFSVNNNAQVSNAIGFYIMGMNEWADELAELEAEEEDEDDDEDNTSNEPTVSQSFIDNKKNTAPDTE